MKKLNRAQRRKTELQKGVELLVSKTKRESHLAGASAGYAQARQEFTKLGHQNAEGVVDIQNRDNLPFVIVRDLPPADDFARAMWHADHNPHLAPLATYGFRRVPMAQRLPQGTLVRWYHWEFTGRA